MGDTSARRRRPRTTPPTLAERIARAAMTPSERAIASHMLGNLHLLPFENAAAIAAQVGVSPMTVSRFLRSIGYAGIGELKDELRGAATDPGLLVTDRLDRIRAIEGSAGALHENLQLEVNALIAVYEQVGTPAWKRTIERFAMSEQVFVAGFQTLGGLASDFAARLQYLRPGVSVVDGSDGTFAEALAGTARKPCVVLFEMRRYTRFSQLLAAACQRRGVPLVVVCDRHCHWAREHTDDIFALDTDSRLFWDCQAPFLSLTNLMLDQVVRRLQPSVQSRLTALGRLQEHFGAFR